jgi:hypothetical protein
VTVLFEIVWRIPPPSPGGEATLPKIAAIAMLRA